MLKCLSSEEWTNTVKHCTTYWLNVQYQEWCLGLTMMDHSVVSIAILLNEPDVTLTTPERPFIYKSKRKLELSNHELLSWMFLGVEIFHCSYWPVWVYSCLRRWYALQKAALQCWQIFSCVFCAALASSSEGLSITLDCVWKQNNIIGKLYAISELNHPCLHMKTLLKAYLNAV